MGLPCCECGGFVEEWADWTTHPCLRQYTVIRDLGEGAFAQTELARNVNTQELVALKVVFLHSPNSDPEHMKIMKNEPELLRICSACPQVVECKEVIDDGQQMVIALEYLSGGQLLDHLHKIGDHYGEQQAAAIFKQIVEALEFMHRRHVMHRDLKPENVMFKEDPLVGAASGRPLRVKVIDLGMGALYDPANPITGPLGSPGFVSPEVVFNEPHSPCMDVWSAGVILFIMLVGRKPFNFEDSMSLEYARIGLKGAPGLQDPRWLDLSAGAKDLLMGMLRYDPEKRLTARQVLEHDWICTQGGQLSRPLGRNVAWGAANVASLRRLKNVVHGAVALRRVQGALQQQQLAPAGSGGNDSSGAEVVNVMQYRKQLRRTRTLASKSMGYRNDAGGRKGLHRMDSVAIRVASKSIKRLHDGGVAVHPDQDISVHYRHYGDRSVRGGEMYERSVRNGGAPGKAVAVDSSMHLGALPNGALPDAAAATAAAQVLDDRSYHAGAFNHYYQQQKNASSAAAAIKTSSSMRRAASAFALSELARASMSTTSREGSVQGGNSLHGGGEGSARMGEREGSNRMRRWSGHFGVTKSGSNASLTSLGGGGGGGAGAGVDAWGQAKAGLSDFLDRSQRGGGGGGGSAGNSLHGASAAQQQQQQGVARADLLPALQLLSQPGEPLDSVREQRNSLDHQTEEQRRRSMEGWTRVRQEQEQQQRLMPPGSDDDKSGTTRGGTSTYLT